MVETFIFILVNRTTENYVTNGGSNMEKKEKPEVYHSALDYRLFWLIQFLIKKYFQLTATDTFCLEV